MLVQSWDMMIVAREIGRMSLHVSIGRCIWFPFGLVNCLGVVDSYWQENNNSSSRQSTVRMKEVGELTIAFESEILLHQMEMYSMVSSILSHYCYDHYGLWNHRVRTGAI